MCLIETIPGDVGPLSTLSTFETVARDRFSIVKPAITLDEEANLIEQLREILDDEMG
jgi:hypothetical protein